MIDVDTSSRKEQRNFGLVMAGAIVALGLIRWAVHGFSHFPTWFFVVAAVFAVLGLVFPVALKPVFIAWMALARVLNWVMTRVFLGLAFYLLITPVRVVLHFASDDPMKRAWDPNADTYWEDAEPQSRDINDYRNQF